MPNQAYEWMDYAAPRLVGREYPERAREATTRPSYLYPVGCIHPTIIPPPDLEIGEERDTHTFGIRFLSATDDVTAESRAGFTVFLPWLMSHEGLGEPTNRSAPGAADSPTLDETISAEDFSPMEDAPEDEQTNAFEDTQASPVWNPQRVELSGIVSFPEGPAWHEAEQVTKEFRDLILAIADEHKLNAGAVTPEWSGPWWDVRILTRRLKTPEGWLCEIALTNALEIEFEDRRGATERAVFDCKLEVALTSPPLPLPSRAFAHWDDRVTPVIHALGLNCGVNTSEANKGRLSIECVPRTDKPHYAQRGSMPKSGTPFPSFQSLSHDRELIGTLEKVSADLHAYVESAEQGSPQRDPAEWRGERDAFDAGVLALKNDAAVRKAFLLVNKSFAEANRSRNITAWRPFQLIGLVSEARHLIPEAGEAPVTVIQMSTGGGKTELYLAISLFHAFLGRLRGEEAGTVAWATFPLRLLSLQQAERILRVLSAANEILLADDSIPSSGRRVLFSVGYYAGGANSANDLWSGGPLSELNPKDSELHREFVEAADAAPFPPPGPTPLALTPPQETLKRNRKVVRCPLCARSGRKSIVQTSFDKAGARFRHVCTECNYQLPLHVSDAEVIRAQPTIIVGTLDKLVRICTHEDDLLVFGGARAECTTHGYCVKPGVKCRVAGCRLKTRALNRPLNGPRVLIQDELHLIKESFGALAAPYERLRASLINENNGSKPRVICSTATITGYQRHISELYGLNHVERLPAPGTIPGDSFHQETTSRTHRIFYGLMPTKVTSHRLVQRLTEVHLRWVVEQTPGPSAFAKWKNFATLLVYCLNKRHLQKHKATLLNDINLQSLRRLGLPEVDSARTLELSGDTEADEVSTALERLEDPQLDDYVKVLYATSMISHGVDLDALNVMIVDGVPNSVSEHIQATSRVGRGAHTGIVLCVYNRMSLRDVSLFPYHALHHEVLEARVPPTNIDAQSQEAWSVASRGYLLHTMHRERLKAGQPSPSISEVCQWIGENGPEIEAQLASFVEDRLDPIEISDILREARLALESEEGTKRPFVVLRLLTSLRDVPEGIPIYPIKR